MRIFRARQLSIFTAAALLLTACIATLGAGTTTPARANVVSDGGQFVALTPFRLVDTKNGIGGPATPLVGAAYRDYQVLGESGVPLTGVSAVVLDVAALTLANAVASNLRVYAPGDSVPEPILWIEEGSRSKSNTVVAKVGANGTIRVRNLQGDVHFNVDVQGYFTTSADGAGYTPIAPVRLASTTGVGMPDQELSGGGLVRDVQITGEEVPSGATAIFANVKVSQAEVNSGLRLGRGGELSTSPASVNYRAGVYSDSGLTISLSDDGKIRIENLAGADNAVTVSVDVQGYFLPGERKQGGYYKPLSGQRVYDTANSVAIPAGGTRTVTLAGLGGFPQASEMGAAVVTVYVGEWTQAGHVAVYPANLPEAPYASNVSFNNNSDPARGLSSTAMVATSSSGAVKILNRSTGSVRVWLNAQGFYTKSVTDPVVQQIMDLAPGITEAEVLTAINEEMFSSENESGTSLTFDQAKNQVLTFLQTEPDVAPVPDEAPEGADCEWSVQPVAEGVAVHHDGVTTVLDADPQAPLDTSAGTVFAGEAGTVPVTVTVLEGASEAQINDDLATGEQEKASLLEASVENAVEGGVEGEVVGSIANPEPATDLVPVAYELAAEGSVESGVLTEQTNQAPALASAGPSTEPTVDCVRSNESDADDVAVHTQEGDLFFPSGAVSDMQSAQAATYPSTKSAFRYRTFIPPARVQSRLCGTFKGDDRYFTNAYAAHNRTRASVFFNWPDLKIETSKGIGPTHRIKTRMYDAATKTASPSGIKFHSGSMRRGYGRVSISHNSGNPLCRYSAGIWYNIVVEVWKNGSAFVKGTAGKVPAHEAYLFPKEEYYGKTILRHDASKFFCLAINCGQRTLWHSTD